MVITPAFWFCEILMTMLQVFTQSISSLYIIFSKICNHLKYITSDSCIEVKVKFGLNLKSLRALS